MLHKIKSKIFSHGNRTPVALRKWKSYTHIRWGCRSSIAAATVLSIWANVLFAHGVIASVLVSLPSLAVLGSIEFISRIRMEGGGWLRRFSRPAATVILAVIAAWLSYWTQKAAIAQYLPDRDHGMLLPFVIDGFMVISAVTLTEVNDRIEAIEVAREASNARTAREVAPVSAPPAPGRRRGEKREAFARVTASAPHLSVSERATLAGIHPSYAAKLERELQGELVAS